MDLYDRRASRDGEPGAAVSSQGGASAAGAPTRGRAKRAKAVPLALLDAHLAAAAAAATPTDHRPKAATPAAASSQATRSCSLGSTSLSLVLHWCGLRDRLRASRTCRGWHEAAASRLAWSGSEAQVRVLGSRDERRTARDALDDEQHRNFNPNDCHYSSSAATASPDVTPHQSSAITPEAQPLSLLDTHPLTHCATACPQLQHLRHLAYHFASPSIRTSLASMWEEDMWTTNVVRTEFPLASLPSGAFPFLSSLSLRDITLCSQLSIQSAFGRIGNQTHSFLRSLELHVSLVLSASEKSQTMSAMLNELGSRMERLEILALPQRHLPREISLEPLLSLHRLHTLVLHASFEKTPERLQVVKALALHSSLKHLAWDGWTSKQIKQLFGGVRHTLEEEEERALAMQRHHNFDIGDDVPTQDPAEEEEAIVGLDADEPEPPPNAAGDRSRLSIVADACFQFEDWTIDQTVSAVNLAQYFACSPPLLPHLTTLHFAQPSSFSSFTPLLPMVLGSLPVLTALRIHASYYSLGAGFWRALSQTPLPQLRRLRLDQISLVTPSHAANDSDPCEPLDIWQAFSGLEELSLANLALPNLVGLATAAPRLRDLRLEAVHLRAQCHSVTGTSLSELLHEVTSLDRLTRLDLIHCDVDSESLAPLAACPRLEVLHLCMLQANHPHRDAHSSCLHEWTSASVRSLDARGDDASGETAGGLTAPPRLTKQHSSGREHQQLTHLHRQLNDARRYQVLRAPPTAERVTGVQLVYWDSASSGTRRAMPADRPLER